MLVKLLGVEKCDRTTVWKSRPSLKQSRITKMLTFMRLEGHSLAFRGNKGQVFRRWQGKVLDISVAGLTRKFLQSNVFSHEIFVRYKPTVSCNCSYFSLGLFGVGFHVSRCRHTERIQNVVNLLFRNRHSSFSVTHKVCNTDIKRFWKFSSSKRSCLHWNLI